MSGPRTWLSIRWPREVTTTQGLAALLALNGLSRPRRRDTLVFQATGTTEGVAHHLAVPDERAGAVIRQLQAVVPGLVIESTPIAPANTVDRAWQAWQSTVKRPLNVRDPEIITTGLLAALSSVEGDERLVLQWLLGPVRRPMAVGTTVTGDLGHNLAVAVAKAPLLAPADLDAEARLALRTKHGLPGWRACLRIGVHAKGTARQRQLLGHLAAATRVAQGPGVQLGFDGLRPSTLTNLRLPLRWPLAINVGELLGLTGWPLGETEHLPVVRVRSRALPPSRAVPKHGRVIGEGTYPGHQRPLALGVRDGLQHLHVIGPTGVGKSTLLLNLITQDLAAGRGCVVIEPKGDLINDVLSRIPDQRLDDVVLLDPTDLQPVGVNPLAQHGVPAELVVDQVLAVFKGLFADSWGPRTQDLLTAGLLTLTSEPGLSLVALPLLFTDAGFRHRIVSHIHDRLALGPFWAWYENLSAAEQAAVLAPLMNKLRTFLLRPRLRRVIGQPAPRLDLREVFTRRRVLLVNLAKGTMGPEAAGLLGSLVVSQLWQTALGRSAVPTDRRHPVFVYVDEFQDYLHLPTDLADVLAQARSLGVGLNLAHQHLGQLTPSVKTAVIANARSRVLFQTSVDDAAVLTRNDQRLTPLDVAGLGRYEAYVSLLASGETTPYASARTLPAPPAVRDPASVRQRSRERWGIPATEIDASLEALVSDRQGKQRHAGPTEGDDDTSGFGVRRRSGRASGTWEDGQ